MIKKSTDELAVIDVISKIMDALGITSTFSTKSQRRSATSKPYTEVRVYSKDLYDAILDDRQDQDLIYSLIRITCPGCIGLKVISSIPSNLPLSNEQNNNDLFGLMIHFV